MFYPRSIRFGRGVQFSDPDAAAYITAAGITDVIEKERIHCWFTGLKNLQVYPLITEMWSFREKHNPGTTIYGMKGVGNAVRFGATWQDGFGITALALATSGVASSTVQTMPSAPGFSVIEVGCVVTGAGSGYGAGYGGGWGGNVGLKQSNGYYFNVGNDYAGALMYNGASLLPADSPHFRMTNITGERAGNTIVDGTTAAFMDAGGTAYSGWGKDAQGSLLTTGIGAGGFSQQTRSFVALAASNVLSAYEPAIRSLYNATIGADLSYRFPYFLPLYTTPWGTYITITGSQTDRFGLANAFSLQFTAGPTPHEWDVVWVSTAKPNGTVVEFTAWAKLGTSTNLSVVLNDGTAWDNSSRYTFGAADGLNASTWTKVTLQRTVNASGQLNLHLGKHGASGITQQVAGTVFLEDVRLTQISA